MASSTWSFDFAGGDVDGNDVPLLHQADGAALGGLGADVADGGAAGSAGEAPVGDKGHRLAQTHAADGGGGVEHLPHTGAALGPLIADDYHVSGVDLLGIDVGDGLLLGVVHPGGAWWTIISGATADCFTTQPSGARLPLSTAMPPLWE
mgnify:CR=1 FL=1